jgi:hypothetical protein
VIDVKDLIAEFPDGKIPPDTVDPNTILTDYGIGGLIPEPTMGVFIEGHTSDGAGQQFIIETLSDGSLILREVGNEAADNAASQTPARKTSPRSAGTARSGSASGEPCGSCPPPCQDDSKVFSGFKESGALKWRIRRRSIPLSLNKAAAMDAIKAGAANVKRPTNTCGLSGGVSISSTYVGRTTNKANLDADGNCLSPNGKNVVDFSTLPVAGRTCSWYAIKSGTDELVEADIRFNRNQRWTLNPKSGGCSRALDLAGTATHEFGHAFGLSHVSTAHKNLTMTELLPLCSTAPRTLGRGDVKGLRALY